MQIELVAGAVLDQPSDLTVLLCPEGEPLPAAIAGLIEAVDFKAKLNQTLLVYPRGAVAARRLLLVGLGPASKLGPEAYRQAAATGVRSARDLQVAALTVGAPATAGDEATVQAGTVQAIAEGLELGSYRYWRFRTGLSPEQTFVVERATVVLAGDPAGVPAAAQQALAAGQAIARGVILARDLVNGPGAVVTPAVLAEHAQELGRRFGLHVTVLDKAQLTEQGFGGILAVGQGSANEPRFIVMEYGQAQAGRPTICLVGKGITFDSGGLSLKPADAMEAMKSDKGGAAAVFGAMQTLAELKLPLHVVGLVAAAENMPSSNAYRPGDIIVTLSGKTVEVLNTDAEGRIVLSDALHYAQRYNPTAMVELSTLTGAVIIALGTHAIGMMGTDPALCERVQAAGESSGERVWQLPLWDEYHQMIKSEVADVKNIGGRAAGSITAGAFLATFVGDVPFVHLDIAGTAWADQPSKPYNAPGGTGVGVRLLTDYLQRYL